MAETFKPGERAPRNGEIQCTQHEGVMDNTSAGETFPPCVHWGGHDRRDCTWEYV